MFSKNKKFSQKDSLITNHSLFPSTAATLLRSLKTAPSTESIQNSRGSSSFPIKKRMKKRSLRKSWILLSGDTTSQFILRRKSVDTSPPARKKILMKTLSTTTSSSKPTSSISTVGKVQDSNNSQKISSAEQDTPKPSTNNPQRLQPIHLTLSRLKNSTYQKHRKRWTGSGSGGKKRMMT